MRKHITESVAKNAKPKDKAYQIHDTLIQGFILRVQPSGKKIWKLVIKRKPQTLGQHPTMTVGMAQAKAKRILTGGDALPELTLEEFLTQYHDEWLDNHSARPKENKDLIRSFGFGDTPMHQILLADLEKWRNRQTNKPRTINRQTAVL